MYKEWEVENEKKDYGKIRSNSNVRNISNYLVLRKLKDAYPDSDSLSQPNFKYTSLMSPSNPFSSIQRLKTELGPRRRES